MAHAIAPNTIAPIAPHNPMKALRAVLRPRAQPAPWPRAGLGRVSVALEEVVVAVGVEIHGGVQVVGGHWRQLATTTTLPGPVEPEHMFQNVKGQVNLPFDLSYK